MLVTVIRSVEFDGVLVPHLLKAVQGTSDLTWLLRKIPEDPKGHLYVGDIMSHKPLYVLGLLRDTGTPLDKEFSKIYLDLMRDLDNFTPEELQELNQSILGGGRCDSYGIVRDLVGPADKVTLTNDWYTQNFDVATPEDLYPDIRTKLRETVRPAFFGEEPPEVTGKFRIDGEVP